MAATEDPTTTRQQDWRIDPVLLLLAALILFFAFLLVIACLFIAGKIDVFTLVFTALCGFVNTLIGALVMRINPKSPAQIDSDMKLASRAADPKVIAAIVPVKE